MWPCGFSVMGPPGLYTEYAHLLSPLSTHHGDCLPRLLCQGSAPHNPQLLLLIASSVLKSGLLYQVPQAGHPYSCWLTVHFPFLSGIGAQRAHAGL